MFRPRTVRSAAWWFTAREDPMRHRTLSSPALAAAIAFLAVAACDSGTVLEPPVDGAPIEALAGAKLTSVNPEVVWESYWYSRYNMMSLMLMSGMGEPGVGDTSQGAVMSMDQFMAMVPMLMGMADADFDPTKLDALMRPSEMYGDGDHVMMPIMPVLLRSVYTSGNPTWQGSAADVMDGISNLDFTKMRWLATPTAMGGSGDNSGAFSNAAQAWTIVKLLEWSRMFEVSFHFGAVDDGFGAQQRFMGMALFAEAVMMLKDMMENGSKYTPTHAGNMATIIAAVDLNRMASDAGSRYSMVAMQMEQMLGMGTGMIAGMGAAMADGMVAALDANSLVTPADISLSIQALTWHNLIGNSTAEIETLASNLATASTDDILSMSHKLRGLLEAQRLGIGDHVSEIDALWESMKVDYEGTTGRFSSKATFTADDLAVILGALNTLRLFPPNQDQDLVSEVNSLMLGFFEATTSVLQLSAPPKMLADGTPVLKGMYEANEPDSWYGHPDVATPPMAGVAPVFGSSITFANGRYGLDGKTMDTAGNMHLSTELLWYHLSFINGFPSP